MVAAGGWREVGLLLFAAEGAQEIDEQFGRATWFHIGLGAYEHLPH